MSGPNLLAQAGWSLTILAMLLAGSATSGAQSGALMTKPAKAPGAELFAATNVWPFQLEINAASLKSLREQPREWAKATLKMGAEVFDDVEVHIKGSEGSLQPIDRRPSLTVSFNKFVSSRRFHGLRKIHFNNTAEDPTFMTEIVCGGLCRQAGLPAARSGYATLTLNGRRLGLYVLKEGLTKEFLAQNFRRTDGVLYDGGFKLDIDQELEVIGGEAPAHQADRLALLAAARDPDPTRRWERLQKVLDTDRFISLLAMVTIMWNWDSYPLYQNNYRLYHDPETDKLVFIPHGMDQMFWQPQGPIYPRMNAIVASAVMQVPEARHLYRQRLATLHTNVFKVDALTAQIDQLAAVIRPFKQDTDVQADRLKRLIAGRAQSIAQQLQTPEPVSPSFVEGVAALAGWAPSRNDKATVLEETRLAAGPRALRIQHEGQATSAWTMRVSIPAGAYEFVGRVKTLRLEPLASDREAGAALRTSSFFRTASPRLRTAADWQEVRCQLIARGEESLELACELRNARGEVWFDLDSLRLKRISPR
jgi:spore coat protein H